MVFISRSLLILSDCGSRLLNNNFLYTKDQLYYQKILCCLKKKYRDIMKEIVEKTTPKKKKKKKNPKCFLVDRKIHFRKTRARALNKNYGEYCSELFFK